MAQDRQHTLGLYLTFKVVQMLNQLRRRLRPRNSYAKSRSIELNLKTQDLIRSGEAKLNALTAKKPLPNRINKPQFELQLKRRQAVLPLTTKSLQNVAKDIGLGGLLSTAENDNEFLGNLRRMPSFDHLKVTGAAGCLALVRSAIDILTEIGYNHYSQGKNKVDKKSFWGYQLDASWSIDEKTHANLLHLLYCIENCLIKTLARQLVSSLSARLWAENSKWKRHFNFLKLGGDKWCSEFSDNQRSLCRTMPWSLRPSLAVLWGVCWMFFPETGYYNRRSIEGHRQQTTTNSDVTPFQSMNANSFYPAPQLNNNTRHRHSSALNPNFTPTEESYSNQLYTLSSAVLPPQHANTPSPEATNSNSLQATENLILKAYGQPLDAFRALNCYSNSQSSIENNTFAACRSATSEVTSIDQRAYASSNSICAVSPCDNYSSELTDTLQHCGPATYTSVGSVAQGINPNYPYAGSPSVTHQDIPSQTVPYIAVYSAPEAQPSSNFSDSNCWPTNEALLKPYTNPLPNMDATEISAEAVAALSNSNPSPEARPHIPEDQLSNDGRDAFSRRGITHRRWTEEPPKDENGKMTCKFTQTCAGIIFERRCEWNKHMDKHERPYKCDAVGCEKLQGFTYSGGLLRHQREVHKMHGGTKDPLYCPFQNCKRASGAGFTRKENRDEHIRRVHRRATSASDGSAGTKRDRETMDAESLLQDVAAVAAAAAVHEEEHDLSENIDPVTASVSKRRRVHLNGNSIDGNLDGDHDLKATIKQLQQNNDYLIKENQTLRRDHQVLADRVIRLEENLTRQFGVPDQIRIA